MAFFLNKYLIIIVSLVLNRTPNQKQFIFNICRIFFKYKDLIPLGCCKSVYYSNEYLKSYECRLLGISSEVKSPFQANPDDDDEKNIFSFSPPSSNANTNTRPSTTSQNTHNVPVLNDLNDYLFVDIIIKPKNFKSTCSSLRKKSISATHQQPSNQTDYLTKSHLKPLHLDLYSFGQQGNHQQQQKHHQQATSISAAQFNTHFDLIDQENYFNITLKTNNAQKLEQGEFVWLNLFFRYSSKVELPLNVHHRLFYGKKDTLRPDLYKKNLDGILIKSCRFFGKIN